jgi:amino acid adenylation domain-containing protein
MARSSPLATALRSGSSTLSYAELDQRSNRLAARLRDLGIGPGNAVAVCVERSFDYVLSGLAIWKAGGAFLPVDPEWPRERRQQVIADACASVLIARPEDATRASKRLEVSPTFWDSLPADVLAPDITPRGQLAYILYTSGSTGRPKGTELTHGNVLNYVFWQRRTFGITSADRSSHVCGLSFDAVIIETWPQLTAGASVAMAPEDVRRVPERLKEWMVKEGVTVSFLPTILGESVIDGPWPDGAKLRVLMAGGDRLKKYPAPGLPFQLFNGYGPTECTVFATCGQVLPKANTDSLPTIGTPLANTQVHLLDEAGNPVAPGEIGEIYIGGAGVGAGYRNARDLTQQRFLPDPFSTEPEAKLYRTGDLGSRLPSGEIAFHGRIDDQEKIRGQRVEPAETAHVLEQHPGIARAVVLGYGNPGDRRLAAFAIAKPGAKPFAAELHDYLSERLPQSLVPTAFHIVREFPLNANGKLDRQALLALCEQQAPVAGEAEPVESPLENRVARLFEEVLGVHDVGRSSNFFLLGGHSLNGTQLVLRLQGFGVAFALQDLFESPTVMQLAAKVEERVVAAVASMPDAEAERLLGLLEQ